MTDKVFKTLLLFGLALKQVSYLKMNKRITLVSGSLSVRMPVTTLFLKNACTCLNY